MDVWTVLLGHIPLPLVHHPAPRVSSAILVYIPVELE